jgi:hypothetical protein
MAPIGVEYTKWIVTGIAAIVAVILASLDSITKHVALGYFKWGTVFLVAALLSGSLAYLISLSLAAGVVSRKHAEALEAAKDKNTPKVTLELLKLFTSPFWGPLRWVVNRSLRKAIADPLYVEKSQIFTVCLVNLLILCTVALAISGMTVFIFGFTAGTPEPGAVTAAHVGSSLTFGKR